MNRAFYECKNLKNIKPYVGIYANSGTKEVFEFDHTPTEKDSLPYIAVIGPFKTLRAAEYMAKYGRNNPHCQYVDDAERIVARKHK